jgi:ABC-2 type transport system ATP-binding protein
MKMELIGAILHWPSVIFLDEPTIGLDVFAAHKLREFLKVFNQKEKATIILTSHNMDDIERLCSRVLILKSGDMIYDGRPEGLTRKGEKHLRIRILEKPLLEEMRVITDLPQDAVEQEKEGEEGENRAFHFHVKQDQIVALLQILMKRFTIVDMGIEEQSLEKVIQRIYSEEKVEGQ